MKTVTLIIVLMATSNVIAAEAGGAYGGGTTPPKKERFEHVDENRDGKVNEEEARSAGIEAFRQADVDENGSLDKAEFSALEADGTLKADE